MIRFLLGVLAGAVFAFAFVRFDLAPPGLFGLPDKVRGNLVSAAVEEDLYDLSRTPEAHTRALKVYFANRADDAARVDAEAGFPFLDALHRKRAVREARQLSAQWSAFDAVLEQPALRAALEKRHGATDTETLKRAQLHAAYLETPFLRRWYAAQGRTVDADTLRAALAETAKDDAPGNGPASPR
ncbi:MAG: hypothetical protein FD160_1793 [Caulobacteraceae bacterium]|nr:MAG: hypothetical protein FD160_1793 [Caulobacteraceae bacterium]